MSKERVLVIIVTYNAKKWIERCLGSLVNSSHPVDVFVVDNCSQDDTVEYIKAHHTEVQLVESKINLGFGKANNIGLQYALDSKYDFIYLLNQDAWIDNNTIATLIEVSKKHPEMGVLSPLQMNDGLNNVDYNFIQCCPLNMYSDVLCGQLKDVYETSFFMAAHWFMPISTIQKVGGFSPSFPHYGEDHNYAERVQYQGMKLGIVPSLSVVHDRKFRKKSKEFYLWQAYIKGIEGISNINKPLWGQLIVQPFSVLRYSRKFGFWKGMLNALRLLFHVPMLVRNRTLSKSFAFLN